MTLLDQARAAQHLTAVLRDAFDAQGDLEKLTWALEANAALTHLVTALEEEG
jgi:hypothetical protein